MKLEKISPKQKQIYDFIYDTDNNILICDGAVRSGKTLNMTIAFVLWASLNFDDTNFAICGKSVGSVERNIIAPFLAVEGFKSKAKYHRSERYLTVTINKRQNRFYVFGGKDESSYQLIQGITVAGVLFDEVALQPRSFVQQAEARTLTFGNKKIWFNCNPEGRLHWFNQEFIIPADEGKRKGIKHLHFLMEDNPIISPSQVEEAAAMFSGVFYQRYILGLWVMTEGLIYDMFVRDIHILTKEPVTVGEYYIASDFGMQNATTFHLYRKEKGVDRWIVLDEYYYSGREQKVQKTVDSLVDGMETIVPTDAEGRKLHIKQVIVDPSAAALIAELRKRGYHVRQAENDVIDGISDVATMLKQNRLAVMSRCKHMIDEFGIYAWDTKSTAHGEDKPIKEHDHCMDDLRYFVRTLHLVKVKEKYIPVALRR